MVHDKLAAGRVNDWPYQGVASSPYVEGDRIYYVSNRAELMCLDTQGFRDKENDGPVTDEKLNSEMNADVVWRFDMIEEVGSLPHNLANSSPVSYGDLIFVSTSNGQDESHVNVPRPKRLRSSPSTRRPANSFGKTIPSRTACMAGGARQRWEQLLRGPGCAWTGRWLGQAMKL